MIPAEPLYTCQISARLLWYYHESLAAGFTIKILGLNFPPIFKVLTSRPSKNLLEILVSEIHQ
jgi:hypothetical protein